MVLYLFSFFQDHFFMVLFLIYTEEERSGCRNRFAFNGATSEVELFVPLMCSPTYHVRAPRTRPHEMWVCKKAKSIVIGFSGGIEGNYIDWTGGLISWHLMMGTSLFSSSSHFLYFTAVSDLCHRLFKVF